MLTREIEPPFCDPALLLLLSLASCTCPNTTKSIPSLLLVQVRITTTLGFAKAVQRINRERESKIKTDTNLDESHVALAVHQVVAKVRDAPLAPPPPDVHKMERAHGRGLEETQPFTAVKSRPRQR